MLQRGNMWVTLRYVSFTKTFVIVCTFNETPGPLSHRFHLTLTLVSVEQNSYSKADRGSAGTEIPRLLWNQKVHYRIVLSPDLRRNRKFNALLYHALNGYTHSSGLWLSVNGRRAEVPSLGPQAASTSAPAPTCWLSSSPFVELILVHTVRFLRSNLGYLIKPTTRALWSKQDGWHRLWLARKFSTKHPTQTSNHLPPEYVPDTYRWARMLRSLENWQGDEMNGERGELLSIRCEDKTFSYRPCSTTFTEQEDNDSAAACMSLATQHTWSGGNASGSTRFESQLPSTSIFRQKPEQARRRSTQSFAVHWSHSKMHILWIWYSMVK